jgi:hypothetical protein
MKKRADRCYRKARAMASIIREHPLFSFDPRPIYFQLEALDGSILVVH